MPFSRLALASGMPLVLCPTTPRGYTTDESSPKIGEGTSFPLPARGIASIARQGRFHTAAPENRPNSPRRHDSAGQHACFVRTPDAAARALRSHLMPLLSTATRQRVSPRAARAVGARCIETAAKRAHGAGCAEQQQKRHKIGRQ